mmetsp:Transcript_17867/g.25187  ORF Transcript_17867/g.25187 Transcript_17867/m.25187 type:complete len:100 (-) Transcript_17867:32-331(-)
MKERIKAKDHSQINCNEVQVKVEEIKKKRKSKVTEKGTRKKTRLEEQAIEKRIQRLRERESVLLFEVPEGKIESIRDQVKKECRYIAETVSDTTTTNIL